MAEEKKIFISQEVLDALFEQGKAELKEDNTLVIHSKEAQSFKLIPGYKFLCLASGDKDPHNLVGKIFTEQELKKAEADIYMDSVIYKDIAYQVETGFLGVPETKKAEKTAQKVDEAGVDDAKKLADLLLKIM